MLDLRLVRNDYDATAASLARRGTDDLARLAQVRELDEAHRAVETERNGVRSEIKTLSRSVGDARRDGRMDEAEELAARSRALGDDERRLDAAEEDLQASIRELLLVIPNLPAGDAPAEVDRQSVFEGLSRRKDRPPDGEDRELDETR